MQAHIDARLDILNELARTFRQNISPSEAIERVRAIAKETASSAAPSASITNPRDYWRNVYANEVLRMDSYAGSEKAVAMSLRPLYKPWPRLRRATKE